MVQRHSPTCLRPLFGLISKRLLRVCCYPVNALLISHAPGLPETKTKTSITANPDKFFAQLWRSVGDVSCCFLQSTTMNSIVQADAAAAAPKKHAKPKHHALPHMLLMCHNGWAAAKAAIEKQPKSKQASQCMSLAIIIVVRIHH